MRLPLRLRISVVFMVVMVVGMTAEAVWLAWEGRPVKGVPLAACAVLLGHVLGLAGRVWRMPRRSRPAVKLVPAAEGKGVRFGYSGWTYYWLTVLLLVTEVVAVAVAAGAALSGSVAGWGVAVVAAAAGVVVGWLLVAMLRLAPGEVVLSPAGIDHRSLASTYFVPWHAVVEVSAVWLSTPVIAVLALLSPQARLHSLLGRRFRTGEVQFLPIMVIRTAWLAADPVTVYHALSFYHLRPELRGELTTHDAIHRIESGRAVRPAQA
jgi:hypothetical protein